MRPYAYIVPLSPTSAVGNHREPRKRRVWRDPSISSSLLIRTPENQSQSKERKHNMDGRMLMSIPFKIGGSLRHLAQKPKQAFFLFPCCQTRRKIN